MRMTALVYRSSNHSFLYDVTLVERHTIAFFRCNRIFIDGTLVNLEPPCAVEDVDQVTYTGEELYLWLEEK